MTERAGEPAAGRGETLDERIGRVIGTLDGLEVVRSGGSIELSVGGRRFAVVTTVAIEAALDPPVVRAALDTPDTAASERGAGWIRFAPAIPDRFALDRAEAWLRSAHRRAGAVSRGH